MSSFSLTMGRQAVAWSDPEILIGVAGVAVALGIAAFEHFRDRKPKEAGSREAIRLAAAKKLSEAVYKVRDELAYCRAPLVSNHEHKTPMDTWENRGQAWREVFRTRWEPVRVSLDELEAASREAEAMFGQDVKVKVGALQQVAREVFVGMEAFIGNEVSRGEDFKCDREFGRKIRSTVFASKDNGTNEINKAVRAAVEDIDAMLAPHLRH
jgi:hypothetical protein